MTRGTPDAIATPVTCASNEKPWNAEELLEHQRELVGRALGDGRDAPVVDELAVVEEPDDGLGVAAVDGEQHGSLLQPSSDREVEARCRARAPTA